MTDDKPSLDSRYYAKKAKSEAHKAIIFAGIAVSLALIALALRVMQAAL